MSDTTAPASAPKPVKIPKDRRYEYVLTLAAITDGPILRADAERAVKVATKGANSLCDDALIQLLSNGLLGYADAERKDIADESRGWVITPNGKYTAGQIRDRAEIAKALSATPPTNKAG